MRFYTIVISDSTTNEILVPNLYGQTGFTRVPYDDVTYSYSSLNAGMSIYEIGGTNPAAQHIELDIAMAYMHDPIANAYVKIWGVSLAEISEGSNLNNLDIAVYGGMAKGLPLANPDQAGLLCTGKIRQAFGNWISTEQTLSIFMQFGGSSPTSNQTTANPATATTAPMPTTNSTPAAIVFQWQKGQDFLSALTASLQTAYPQYSVQGAVSPNLVWNGPTVTGFFATLKQLAEFIKNKSLSIVGGYAPDNQLYSGVNMSLVHNVITVTDGSTQTVPKQIQFADLIGQPTWIDQYEVQATCVMRADINLWDYVALPLDIGTTTAGSNSQYYQPIVGNEYNSLKNGAVFSGTFMVKTLRHVGQFRNPDGLAWVSVLNLLLMSPSVTANQVDSYPVLMSGIATTPSSGTGS